VRPFERFPSSRELCAVSFSQLRVTNSAVLTKFRPRHIAESGTDFAWTPLHRARTRSASSGDLAEIRYSSYLFNFRIRDSSLCQEETIAAHGSISPIWNVTFLKMAARPVSHMQIGWVSVERSYAEGWYPASLVRGAVSRLRSQPLPRSFGPFRLGGSEPLYYSRFFLLDEARPGRSHDIMAVGGMERNCKGSLPLFAELSPRDFSETRL